RRLAWQACLAAHPGPRLSDVYSLYWASHLCVLPVLSLFLLRGRASALQRIQSDCSGLDQRRHSVLDGARRTFRSVVTKTQASRPVMPAPQSTIFVFRGFVEADRAKTFLESKGIPAILVEEEQSRSINLLDVVHLRVAEGDA